MAGGLHPPSYAVSGGDRDNDGIYASDGDKDEYETIYQVNTMHNIAPQYQSWFNGSGGEWFALERWIQDKLVNKHGVEAWVYAGTIFLDREPKKIGPKRDIGIPPFFYQMVIFQQPSPNNQENKEIIILPFLFPHEREFEMDISLNDRNQQRKPKPDIRDLLVSVHTLQVLTGRNFFPDFPSDLQEQIEYKSGARHSPVIDTLSKVCPHYSSFLA